MKKRYIIQHPKKGIFIEKSQNKEFWTAHNYGADIIKSYFNTKKEASKFIEENIKNKEKIKIIQIPRMNGDISALSLALLETLGPTDLHPYPTENKVPC